MSLDYKYKWEIVDPTVQTFNRRAGNSLLAWTFGKLTNAGWDSEKSPSLELITDDLKFSLKHKGNNLTVAIPIWAKEYNFAPNKNVDAFNIYVYEDLSKNPIRGLTFPTVTFVNVIPRKFAQILFGYDNPNYSYLEVLLKIEGTPDRFL
jgi:hypothetical protein